MTMLVAHSAWGIVTPEICGARFRQGTSGERDGTGSGLSGGSVACLRRTLTRRIAVAQWPWVRAGAGPESWLALPTRAGWLCDDSTDSDPHRGR